MRSTDAVAVLFVGTTLFRRRAVTANAPSGGDQTTEAEVRWAPDRRPTAGYPRAAG